MFIYLSKLGLTLRFIKLFPLFELSHYILNCMAVRNFTLSINQAKYSKEGKLTFSRVHPFASWFSSILMCFAGGFLGNLLLGEPLITPFQNTRDITIVTIVWYLVNYSPLDIFGKLLSLRFVMLLLSVAKEIRRVIKIDQGVVFAAKVLPYSRVIPLLFGALKGTSSSHMRVIHRLVCGVWQPSSIEILHPLAITKSSTLVSGLFLLYYLDYLPIPISYLHLLLVLICLLTRFLEYFSIDPYRPFENLIACIFTGGLSESFKMATKITNNKLKFFDKLNFNKVENENEEGSYGGKKKEE